MGNAPEWKKIFTDAWREFSPGYLPNLVVSLIFLLITPAIGAVMNKPKIIIGSLALGLTVLIWVLAIYLMRNASSQPALGEGASPTPAPTPAQHTETELHGLLIPADEPSPPNPCDRPDFPLPPSAVSMFLGNVVAWTTGLQMTVIQVREWELLSIKKTPQGLAISAKVFSTDGKIVADIEDNEFQVNHLNYFKVKRPDRSTFIIYDQQGRAVLNVRYLNPQAIKVSGIFQAPQSIPIVIDERLRLRQFDKLTTMCLGNNRIGLFIGDPLDLIKGAEKSSSPHPPTNR